MKHFIQEEEHLFEEKFEQWKNNVHHYSEQLKERISGAQAAMKQQLNMTHEQDFLSNLTYSRLGYLQNVMDSFKTKMSSFSDDLVSRID